MVNAKVIPVASPTMRRCQNWIKPVEINTAATKLASPRPIWPTIIRSLFCNLSARTPPNRDSTSMGPPTQAVTSPSMKADPVSS